MIIIAGQSDYVGMTVFPRCAEVDLGFVCDGRYIFTQRSLENAPLPEHFRAFAAV